VLQGVACVCVVVCCSKWIYPWRDFARFMKLWSECVAACCVYVVQCVAVCCEYVMQCVAVCCRVLQSVAVCCSVLQCVAVCCIVLQ